jgi:hypothetical protein
MNLRDKETKVETHLNVYIHWLSLVENRFGQQQRLNVEDMAKIRLKRKILGD